MRILLKISICLLIFVNFSFAETEPLKLNSKAPGFTVVSGAGEIISLDSLIGKIVVLIYEKKDVVKKTRPLKDVLYKIYWNQPEEKRKNIVRLPVIDCSSAFWPVTTIWKKKLVENSIKEGVNIFGDWDGKMCENYNLKDKNSTVIVIDKKGVIKYIASDDLCSGKEIKTTLEKI